MPPLNLSVDGDHADRRTTEPFAPRLLVVEPSGAICSLDGATGALRWRSGGAAIDAQWADARAFVALSPGGWGGGDDPGVIMRLDEGPAGPTPTAMAGFDGATGRLLHAGETIVGMSWSQGTTLFVTDLAGGSGSAWGGARSALAMAVPSGLRVLSLHDDGELLAGSIAVGAAGQLGALQGVAALSLPWPRGALAAIDGAARLVHVDAASGALTARDLDGTIVSVGAQVPGAEGVREAWWAGGAFWAVLEPAGVLARVGVEGSGQTALEGDAAWASPLPPRRLWATSRRAYVALDGALRAYDADAEGQIVAAGGFAPGCPASTVTGRW